MAICAAGPPKPVKPSKRKYRAISPNEPGEARGLSERKDGVSATVTLTSILMAFQACQVHNKLLSQDYTKLAIFAETG
jgi:hypothetical protein